MGLNLNYTKPDGQAANYWKISRVEDWFQGTDPESSQYMANVNSLGFTNETYRNAGAPSVADNMFTCNYASGTDFYAQCRFQTDGILCKMVYPAGCREVMILEVVHILGLKFVFLSFLEQPTH